MRTLTSLRMNQNMKERKSWVFGSLWILSDSPREKKNEAMK
jgi:hypothetical protein